MMSLEDLKLALRRFGLNPQAWDVQATRDNQYLILNKRDRGFSFVGRAARQRPVWVSIRLRSI